MLFFYDKEGNPYTTMLDLDTGEKARHFSLLLGVQGDVTFLGENTESFIARQEDLKPALRKLEAFLNTLDRLADSDEASLLALTQEEQTRFPDNQVLQGWYDITKNVRLFINGSSLALREHGALV